MKCAVLYHVVFSMGNAPAWNERLLTGTYIYIYIYMTVGFCRDSAPVTGDFKQPRQKCYECQCPRFMII